MFDRTTARHRTPGGPAAGFTIIELMITIALASIVMAIAVPSFNQMIVSGRLTAQTNEMVGAMSLARSEAIKRNATVTFCRTTNGATCATAAGNWGSWIVRVNAGGEIVQQGVVNTFGGTLVVRSTLTNDQVAFGPDGLARTNGTVVADHTVTVCSTRRIDRNVRDIVLGAGSRMSTGSADRACSA